MLQTIVAPKEKLEQKAAEIISDKVNEILKKKAIAVLGIPGGRSVSGIFSLLKEKELPWSKIHIFLVDERCVSINDKESNYKMAEDSFISELVSKGKLPKSNVRPFNYNSKAKDFGASVYSKELQKVGGHLDVVLLSSGEDGHVASLYPNHPSIVDNSSGYIPVANSPKPPAHRVSASRNLLSKSQTVVVLFFGETKKNAYNNFATKAKTTENCPAKLAMAAKNCYVLTDL